MEILRYAAFTDRPDGGNPAGVVLDATGADEPTMLAAAAELGYSETAFVVPGERPTIRYFSPKAEVAFCGHATIATAVAHAERHGPGRLSFDSPAGRIEVAVDEALRATLTSVPTHTRPAEPAEVAAALGALRWTAAELDPELPAHVAFAGNDHLVLAAGSRARLADLDYDFDALGALMAERDWTTVHLVWRESDGVFHARDPFPPGGVVEDPATGAAAAAFGGYLRELGLLRTPVVIIRQGEDLGRPSLLRVTPSPVDGRVAVSGRAVPLLA